MEKYIGFKLGHNEYSVPVLKVREVINLPNITRLPFTLPFVEGIANFRGSLIPIVNLKKIINSTDDYNTKSKVIVVTGKEMTFGIMVDDITGIINKEKSYSSSLCLGCLSAIPAAQLLLDSR